MRSWLFQPLRTLWLVGALTIFAFAFGAAAAIWQLRRHEISDAERTLVTIDYLLRDQTERALQSVDLILQNVYEKIQADGVTNAADYERLEGGAEMRDILRARSTGVPQLDAVTMIGADGKLINFSRSRNLPQINVADRAYFQQLRDDPGLQTLLSEPLQNRTDGKWTVYLARRLSGADGAFIGLILGAIDLSYFENLYRSLQVGEGGAVSLWRSDSTLLARYPPLDRVGERVPIRSFSGILQGDKPVTYHAADAIDGRPRVVATIGSMHFPVVINVTETLDQVLEDWRHFATFIVFGVIALRPGNRDDRLARSRAVSALTRFSPEPSRSARRRSPRKRRRRRTGPAGAEARSRRPADGRHRARFQQSADGRARQHRIVEAPCRRRRSAA